MAQRNIHHPIDDIARQARQGSVAAIIQTLNEQLADVGVRTRAVFADGVLQLLCEGASQEQLEPSVLVPQIRQILETVAPRNIRRVTINSRIVREQQLLWLEEIMRDPENQLLWSEEIILTKPNLFKRIAESIKNQQSVPRKTQTFPNIPAYNSRDSRDSNRYRYGIASGVGLTLLFILVGWFLYDRLSSQLSIISSRLSIKITTQSPSSTAESSPPAAASTSVPSLPSDPFVEAVRLAEQASQAGQTVRTSAQWLDLAARWERASALMGAVKPDDQRYKTAQDRMKLYRKNSEAAQKQAIQSRS